MAERVSGKAAAVFFGLLVLGGTINLVKTGNVMGEEPSSSYSRPSTSYASQAPYAVTTPNHSAQPGYPAQSEHSTQPATRWTAPAAPTSSATVAEVIDGDTFVISSGERVRLLGIDACEMSTPGGREAKQAAESRLSGRTVTMIADGKRDIDQYGRLLRRVNTVLDPNAYEVTDNYVSDLGMSLVREDSVAIYEGPNDASDDYLAELRDRDTTERDCATNMYEPAPVTSRPDIDLDVDRPFVPRPRSGNSGHPCLPGERDGDGDGFCKEGR